MQLRIVVNQSLRVHDEFLDELWHLAVVNTLLEELVDTLLLLNDVIDLACEHPQVLEGETCMRVRRNQAVKQSFKAQWLFRNLLLGYTVSQVRLTCQRIQDRPAFSDTAQIFLDEYQFGTRLIVEILQASQLLQYGLHLVDVPLPQILGFHRLVTTKAESSEMRKAAESAR